MQVRSLDTKDDESLNKFLKNKPVIRTGIQNNGKIINASQIITSDDTEFYNSSTGIVVNYYMLIIKEKAIFKNYGELYSLPNRYIDNNILGNAPNYSLMASTKKEINSIIRKEMGDHV